MRRLIAVIATAAVVESAALLSQATFRSGVDAVAVYAVVTGRDGRPVDDLRPEDFRITDQGRPVPITLFSRERQPLSVALLLDTSESTLGKVFRIRDAARAFVHTLEPEDRVRIGTFGDEIAVGAAATGDRATLDRILLEELWPGGATPLWNALDAGMSALSGEPGRRVVIAVTDGDNTASLPGFDGTLAGVQRRAVADDFMLYGIGMEGGALSKAMVDLTVASGGAHVDIKRDADLDATFAGIADELRHQYLLGFVPIARDGTIHDLDVRVTRSGLKVRSRRNYLPSIGTRAPAATTRDATITPAPTAATATSSPARTIAVLIDATIGNESVGDVAAWLDTRAGTTDRLLLGVMTKDVAWSAWSSDGAALRAWLTRATRAADFHTARYGPSPIWDSAGAAIEGLAPITDTRDLILITDGRASGNRASSTDIAARARAAGVRVSTIVTHRPQPLSIGKGVAILLHPEYQPKVVATATRGLCVERMDGPGAEPLAATIDRLLTVLR